MTILINTEKQYKKQKNRFRYMLLNDIMLRLDQVFNLACLEIILNPPYHPKGNKIFLYCFGEAVHDRSLYKINDG